MSVNRAKFPAAQAIEALASQFGPRLSTAMALREQHSNGLSWIERQPPDAVVFVRSADEVQQVVRTCSGFHVPIIPYGAGTSLEGQINAPCGGICIDLSEMNSVLSVHAEDLDCVVQPGITRKVLNEYLRDQGLFFPVDPGADASIGGMASTRASGTNAVRYGTMKDNVIALKAVLANGEIITTSTRAKKSSSGYDLTRLLIGSEGTLGVITELTLRLQGIPEAIAAGICPFPSIKAACDATIATIQSGLGIARIELLDAVQVQMCNVYSKLTLPEVPLLLVEFHGTEAGVAEQSHRFADIAAEFGGGAFEWSVRAEERTRLWQARHDAYWALRAAKPGLSTLTTDVCVPISRLAECVVETQRDLQSNGFIAPIVGHVGDGNFHVNLTFDLGRPEEVDSAKAFVERLSARALSMEGTCTGEHGVGQGKIHFLVPEHGPASISAMRAIKQALDPGNILNPGKMFPDEVLQD